MRTEYFLFVHHTTNIFAKLSTWCFEHSGDIICSLLINSSHTDESCKGQNTCLRLLTFIIFVCYILSRYFKFEPGFKVRWCRTRNLGRARDLTYQNSWPSGLGNYFICNFLQFAFGTNLEHDTIAKSYTVILQLFKAHYERPIS